MLNSVKTTAAFVFVAAALGAALAVPSAPMTGTIAEPAPDTGSQAGTPLDRHLARCLRDLQSPSDLRRRAAARALTMLASPRSIDALRNAAGNATDEPFLREVATALFVLGEPEGERILIELSRTGSDRYLALVAMGEAAGGASAERLREVLDGDEALLRPAALTALVRRREPGWEIAVSAGLRANRWDMREAARIHVSNREAVKPGVLDDAWSRGSPADRLALLGRIGADPSVKLTPFLARIAASGSPVERVAAASALAGLGDTSAMPVLERAIRSGNELLRARALIAISRLLRAVEDGNQ